MWGIRSEDEEGAERGAEDEEGAEKRAEEGEGNDDEDDDEVVGNEEEGLIDDWVDPRSCKDSVSSKSIISTSILRPPSKERESRMLLHMRREQQRCLDMFKCPVSSITKPCGIDSRPKVLKDGRWSPIQPFIFIKAVMTISIKRNTT